MFLNYLVAVIGRANVVAEIVLQSRVEFNVEAEEQDVLAFAKAEIDETQTSRKAT